AMNTFRLRATLEMPRIRNEPSRGVYIGALYYYVDDFAAAWRRAIGAGVRRPVEHTHDNKGNGASSIAIRHAVKSGKTQLTEWKTDPQTVRAKMAGDRGDDRTGLWPRDRGAGT